MCVCAAPTGSGAYGSSNSVMGYGQAVSRGNRHHILARFLDKSPADIIPPDVRTRSYVFKTAVEKVKKLAGFCPDFHFRGGLMPAGLLSGFSL